MIKMETLTQDQIREINRANIIKLIKQQGEITKLDLAEALKLSIPTITANANQLIEEGLVETAGMAVSTGGRKPVILKFVENARYSFGVNIAPDRVDLLLINLKGDRIAEASFPSDRDEPFSHVLNRVDQEIEGMLKSAHIDKSRVSGVGISLPGLVDEDRLILEYAPNIGVKDYDFSRFQERLQLKLFIENEANVAAFAEIEMGKITEMRNVVCVSITDGVGTGIIIDQHIYKSSKKKAGEFGHMRVSSDGAVCNCGRTGCWELIASKKALFKNYQDLTGRKAASLECVFSDEFFETPEVQNAIEKYIDGLFVGIENIILGLNPEYVIIGGELGRYSDKMMALMNRSNHMKSNFVEYEGTKVIFSDLKDQGSLIGAALLPFEELFNGERSIIS